MAKKYPVIAEMVDIHTGNRFVAGQTFESGDDEQVERLTKAGCLAAPKEQSSLDYEKDNLAELPLDTARHPALLAIAKHEGAELAKGDATSAADLKKAILARRAIVAPDYDRDGLKDADPEKANEAQLRVIASREAPDAAQAQTVEELISAITAARKPAA